MTALLITQDQVLIYQAAVSLITGDYKSETTEQYFFKDIVSVSTKSDRPGVEHFVITTSGGSVETVLTDLGSQSRDGDGQSSTSEIDRGVQVIRKMLREQKQTA